MSSRSQPFNELPSEIRELFSKRARLRSLAAGQELFGHGSAPDAMFGVTTGRVAVSIFSDAGRRFFATELGVGQWFGETPLLDAEARAFHAQALVATEVAVLPAEAFWEVTKAHPEAMVAVARLVAERYRLAVTWIEAAALKPLQARVASVLLYSVSNRGDENGSVAISQDTLASHLGVARQSVNRVLKQWERDGVIHLAYSSVKVLDRASLVQVASQFS